MPRLEVFFDYICPYCLTAHRYLEELAPQYPAIEVVWRPCESHPRPEPWHPHSDLAIQAMLFAGAAGADLWAVHDRLYTAVHRRRADIERVDVLCEALAGLVEEEALRRALKNGDWRRAQREGNGYAFGQNGVWAVPAYRMEGKRLDAVENVGVTKEQLRAFLDGAAP